VSLLDEGMAAVRRGALDEAFALFERDCRASRHRPSYYWWFLADHVLGCEERVEATLHALDRLLASTREPSERREASWKQGKLLERLGRTVEAERAFARAAAPATERPRERQAAAEEPPPADGEADDRARTWHHRGAALLAGGHPQEALACFERSLADNSGEWGSVDVMRVAELDRARALAALGRHEEALTMLGRSQRSTSTSRCRRPATAASRSSIMPRQPRRRPSAGRPRRRCGASSRRPAASPGGFRVCWRPRSRRPGGSSTRPDKGDSMPVLDGQVAIVTGGGSGIGEVTAGLLAAEGAQVVICGRRPAPIDAVAKTIEKAGGRCAARAVDLEDPDAAAAFVRWTLERWGRVDVLVNNAGHSSHARSIRWVGRKEWDSVLAVNLTAVYVLTQAVLPGMIERQRGTIVTVGSLAALKAGLIGGAPYGAAKAAVRNLMEHVHNTLRNQGIRATIVMPAEVDTPILDKRPLNPDAAARVSMMQAEDVARAIMLAVTLPPRTVIEEIVMSPTILRDQSRDLAVAGRAGGPDERQP